MRLLDRLPSPTATVLAGALGALLLLAACAPAAQTREPRMRTLSPDGPSHYHRPVTLQVAWHPYVEHELVATGDDVWKAVRGDGDPAGEMPVLVVSYPDSSRTVSLRMDIDDALLGKLVKHTLMTQKPIEPPLSQFLAETACASCHPADVELE